MRYLPSQTKLETQAQGGIQYSSQSRQLEGGIKETGCNCYNLRRNKGRMQAEWQQIMDICIQFLKISAMPKLRTSSVTRRKI